MSILLMACLLSAGSSFGQTQSASTPALHLSHQQAIELGIANLLQARIARELREEIKNSPGVERGAFDWQLQGAVSTARLEYGDWNPKTSGLNSLYFTENATANQARSAALALSKLTYWGGNFSLNVSSNYNAFAVNQTNQQLYPSSSALAQLSYSTVNPYTGRINFSYTQPLLRGFGSDAVEAKLKVALEQAKQSDDTFRQRLVDLITMVDSLYWDVVYSKQNLENKEHALSLAKKQLQEDQERVKAGMLGRIELPQVEAAVVEREKQLYEAQAISKNAEAALLNRLFPDEDMPESIELTSSPQSGSEPVELKVALSTAMTHRPELSAANHELTARKIQEAAAGNFVLPQLDTQVAFTHGSTAHPNVSGVWDDFSHGHYPGYYVGLNFSYPLENSYAQARFSQAKAATRGAQFMLKDVRTSIALDVQQSYTNLINARKEVDAASKALSFRVESLDAEMSKLESGMSISFFVLMRQDELDQAKAADIKARISAEKARTNLARAMGTLVDSAAQI